jgi:hypothetical protein
MKTHAASRPRSLATLLILLGVLAACAAPGSSAGDGAEPTGPEASRRFPSAVPTSAEPSPAGAPDDLPAAIWAAILDDLSTRLGAPVTDPTVVSVDAVTWSDGALGCPEPGQLYTQALVDGYQVVVEIDGTRYDYRTGVAGTVRLCEGLIEGGG